MKLNALKKIRMNKGITRKELSEKSGVKERLIIAYENEERDQAKMHLDTAIKLAEVLECRPEEFANKKI